MSTFQSQFLLKLKDFSRTYLKETQNDRRKDKLNVEVDVDLINSTVGQQSAPSNHELTSASTISTLLENSIEAMKDLYAQVVITSDSLNSNSLDQVFRPLTDHILLISQQNQTILFQQSRLIDSIGNLEKTLNGSGERGATDNSLLEDIRNLLAKLSIPEQSKCASFDEKQSAAKNEQVGFAVEEQVESINPFDGCLQSQQEQPKIARLQSIFAIRPPRTRKDVPFAASMPSIAEDAVVEESHVKESTECASNNILLYLGDQEEKIRPSFRQERGYL